MGKRIRIGDVIEIRTSRGLAYAQFQAKEALHGSLIRVLPGFHATRPADLEAVVARKEAFVAFVPLQSMVNRSACEVVANHPLPTHARQFPLFRAGTSDPQTGKVANWWLWDGEQEWVVGNLTEAQRDLPIRSTWTESLLVKNIEMGWTPRTDPR